MLMWNLSGITHLKNYCMLANYAVMETVNVWNGYNFTAELTAMKKAIGNIRPFSEVNGTNKNLSHYDKWDNSITFVQYQSGAMGLNLQKADTIIYFSLPLSSELFEQSKKRIHRINQTRKCTYYIFMCENSVEQKIYS